MIEKRKTPWGVFLIVLIIMMIAAYFGCGLFNIIGNSDFCWNNE